MELCGHEYAKILKHVSTRWLSLERCVQRTLEKYSGLKSYQRFSRLRDAFTNPPTEVALLCHHASIPLFNNFNKLLQSEEPIIHMLHDSTIQLARSLANRIITPQVLKDTPVTELNMDDPQIYKPEHTIFKGVTTKFKLQKLLNDGALVRGSIPGYLKQPKPILRTPSVTFYKFPLSNELIMKAGWIDVGSRIDSKWESMEFFINRFKAIFQQLLLTSFMTSSVTTRHSLMNVFGMMCWRKLKWLTEKRMERCFFSTEWMSCGGILLSLSSPAQLLNDSNICQKLQDLF